MKPLRLESVGVELPRITMGDYLLYLVPMIALLFFFLLAILACCYYINQQKRKDKQKIELNDAQQIAAETKKRSHSAMNDFLVVVHP